MAKLPDATDLGQRPTPQDNRGVVSVRNAGAVGEAVAGIGETLQTIAARQQQSEDQLDAAKAKSAFIQKKLDIQTRLDQDPNYQDHEAKYTAAMTQAKTDILAGVRNHQVRGLLEADLGTDAAAGLAEVKQRAYKMKVDDNRGQLSDLLDTNSQLAVAAKSPTDAQGIINSTNQALASARAAGFITAAEETKQRQTFAENYAENYANGLPDQARLKLLKPGTLADGRPDFGAKTNTPIDFLSPDKRLALISKTESQIKADAAEARRQAREAEVSNQLARIEFQGALQSDLESRQATGKGVVDDSQVQAIMGPKGYAEWNLKRQRAESVFNAVSSLTGATPQDISAHVADLQPKGGEPDFADREKAYEAAATAAQHIMAQRKADPATAAMTEVSAVRSAFQQADASNDPADLARAINLSVTTQRDVFKLGPGEIAPLPKQAAVGIVDRFQHAATPDEKLGALAPILALPDPTARKAAVSQLEANKLPAGTGVALDRLKAGDTQAARDIVTALTIEPDKLPKTDPATLKSNRADAPVKVFASGTVGGVLLKQAQLTGLPGQMTDLQTRANLADRLVSLHTATGQESPVDKTTAALNGNSPVIDSDSIAHVVLPQGIDAGVTEARLRTLRGQVADDLAKQHRISDNPVQARINGDLISTVRKSGVWVNSGDGFVLVAPTGGKALSRGYSLDEVQKTSLDGTLYGKPLGQTAKLAGDAIETKPAVKWNDYGYGTREDGTPKGKGFFGMLPRPDGQQSSELSIGVNIDGKEVSIPSLVPTLTKPEIDHMLSGGKATPEIARKAADFARARMKRGLPAFATPDEEGKSAVPK